MLYLCTFQINVLQVYLFPFLSSIRMSTMAILQPDYYIIFHNASCVIGIIRIFITVTAIIGLQ